MNLLVKTLKGDKFTINCEPHQKISEVKALVEKAKEGLSANTIKLICSGKVLKDEETIESSNVKPNDFLVVMVTKPKKQSPPPATTPAPKTSSDAPPPAAPAAKSDESKVAAESTTTTSSSAPSSTTPASPPAAAPPSSTTSSSQQLFPAEIISNLTGMGFPEDMVLACLRAAQGNADLAVEFLTNGIPPNLNAAAPAPSAQGSSSSSNDPLMALRNHPQLNQLRTLVQTNPGALQQVLTQIGQQQPELLEAINSNQAAFLELMNEPIQPSTSSTGAAPAPEPAAGSGAEAPPLGVMPGLGNPAEFVQALSSLSPEELNDTANMLGISPQELMATAQAIGQMPPEILQQQLMQAAGQAGGMPGGGPRQINLDLTEDEMAAVQRLTDMGFDRMEAVQAFLACDKNEALAANLLMDSLDGGGFGGPPSGGQNDEDDEMYD